MGPNKCWEDAGQGGPGTLDALLPNDRDPRGLRPDLGGVAVAQTSTMPTTPNATSPVRIDQHTKIEVYIAKERPKAFIVPVPAWAVSTGATPPETAKLQSPPRRAG